MKKPNGIVPKPSRGLWSIGKRSNKARSRPEVTAEEAMSIKLGIVPGGDTKDPAKRKAFRAAMKKAAKQKETASRGFSVTGAGAKSRAVRYGGEGTDGQKVEKVTLKRRTLRDLTKKWD